MSSVNPPNGYYPSGTRSGVNEATRQDAVLIECVEIPTVCPKCKKPGQILRRTEYAHYSATIYRCTQGCRSSPYRVRSISRDPAFHFVIHEVKNRDGTRNAVVSESWEEICV